MAKLEHYAELYAKNKLGHKKVKLWTIPFAFYGFYQKLFAQKGFKYV